LLLLLFFLPFTWGRHRRARATTALPRATSLELLILFGVADYKAFNLIAIPFGKSLAQPFQRIVQGGTYNLPSGACMLTSDLTTWKRERFCYDEALHME
jgi:hypothetical protein